MSPAQKFLNSVPLLLLVLFSNLPAIARPYSLGPRQTGEVILDESVIGPKGFIIRVGSNGCTGRNSFDVSVKKEPGVSDRAPHYVLTVVRKVPDECKAIVDDGAVIAFDLQKDCGITGNYTYSLSNPVSSPHPFLQPADSFFSSALKDKALPVADIREVRPQPFEQFTMVHGYFSCLLPVDWKRSHDLDEKESSGIYQVRLTRPGMSKPEDGEKYYFPEPLIYVGYYSARNSDGKTYESFIADYERLRLKNAGSRNSSYRRAEKSTVGGHEATITAYEVFQDTPRGPLFTNRYWLKARFVVIRAREGFYVVALKSPRDFYDQCLPTFQAVLDSFKPAR
jgi:hypothetical protein